MKLQRHASTLSAARPSFGGRGCFLFPRAARSHSLQLRQPERAHQLQRARVLRLGVIPAFPVLSRRDVNISPTRHSSGPAYGRPLSFTLGVQLSAIPVIVRGNTDCSVSRAWQYTRTTSNLASMRKGRYSRLCQQATDNRSASSSSNYLNHVLQPLQN